MPQDGSNCTEISKPELWTLSEYAYVLGGADVDVAGHPVGSKEKLQVSASTTPSSPQCLSHHRLKS